MSDEQAAWNAAFAPPKLEKVDSVTYEENYNALFLEMIKKQKEQPNNENQ